MDCEYPERLVHLNRITPHGHVPCLKVTTRDPNASRFAINNISSMILHSSSLSIARLVHLRPLVFIYFKLFIIMDSESSRHTVNPCSIFVSQSRSLCSQVNFIHRSAR